MRDIPTKADGSDSLAAAEFNSTQDEVETAVTASGLGLDGGGGPDNDLEQLAKSIQRHALAGQSYQDGGAANSYVLTAIQAGIKQPVAYYDGMKVTFKVGTTNTGASQINVNAIGLVSFTKAGGAAHVAGEVAAGNIVTAQYFSGTNRFEEVSNTTPLLTGPAAPNQVAVYTDDGAATGFNLTIVSPYVLPAAFTDQMVIIFKANATNDGVGTHSCNVVGISSKNVVERDDTNPLAGRIKAGDWVMLVFSELLDALEIAFVSETQQPDTIFPATTGASSGVFYALESKVESRAPTAYVDGMTVIFRAPSTNSGSVNVEVDSLGSKSLRKENGQNYPSGEIRSGSLIIAQFIASEDRFRAFAARLLVPDIRDDLTVRLSNPATSTVVRNSATLIDWNAPVSDPFGMYNGGSQTAVIPNGEGIERVDISLQLTHTVDNDDFSIARILVDGVVQASSSQSKSAGNGNASHSLFLMDFPVSDGDRIDAQITISPAGGGTETVSTGELVVRVSKVTPP